MTRTGRRGHSPEFRARVVSAIVRGCKVRDVAAFYEVSKASIHLWTRAAGLEKSKGKPPACHPDRKPFGKGYCAPCYKRLWAADGHVDKVS